MNYANKKLTLNGTVDSEAKRLAIADKFAQSTDGVEIINNLKVVEPVVLKEPNFKWQRNNGKLEIFGNVATATSNYADAAATCAVDSANIDNKLVVSDEYKELPWTQKVFDQACASVNESPDFALGYNNGKLTLNGTVESDAVRDGIANKFIAASDGIEVVNLLKVQKAVEIPTPVASSEVDSPATVVPEVTADVAEAVPSVASPEVVLDNPTEVVPTPEVAVAETSPEVTAPEQTPEVAVANTSTPIEVKLRPPSLRIDVSSEQVRLNGDVPTTTEQANAELGFADKNVDNKLRVDSEIANPDYLDTVISLGPELAQELDRVTINLENEKLTILGVAETEEQRKAIGDYVQNRLEPDVTVVNKLTVQSTIPFIEDGK